MQHIREAFALFARHPKLWSFVIKPLGWSALLYLGLIFGGYWLVVPPIQRLFEAWDLGWLGGALGLIIYLIAWFFLSGMVFLALVSFFSSLVWDRMSVEVEMLTTGSAPSHRVPVRAQLADSIQRTVLTILLSLVGLVSVLCVPVIGPVLVAAYLGLLDFTAPAFVRRGKLLGEQRRELRYLNSRGQFALAAGVLSIIPFLNVLMLPILVAAGTIMVARSGIRAEAEL
jgi:uncharacterized protein involved in cysteine biosynthesis